MINLNDHVVEIEGKKYVPFDIAVKAANNAVDNLVKKISSKHEQLYPNRNKSNDDIITASL